MISIIIPSHNEPNICKMYDRTAKIFPEAQIIIAHDPDGRGKGWAIREGLKQAIGNVIVFIDGDLDIDPREIAKLLPKLLTYDIVVGKKDLRGFLSRRVLTILSRVYIRAIFGIQVDTQTGVKAFWRYALPAWETDGFAFDIEILAKAKRAGCTMHEETIDADIVARMKISSVWKTWIESIRIWKEVILNGNAKENG
jgi:glycosyltransferase involved in cell wall biosynthesis